MKVYLTGAISNNPAYQQDFQRAWKRLNDAGYAVVSPVIFCNDSMSWQKRLRRRIQVLSTCQNVAVIPTEYQSASTCLELNIASVLSMKIKSVDGWVELAHREKQRYQNKRNLRRYIWKK